MISETAGDREWLCVAGSSRGVGDSWGGARERGREKSQVGQRKGQAVVVMYNNEVWNGNRMDYGKLVTVRYIKVRGAS